MAETNENLKKIKPTDIICYNCLRVIDALGIEEGNFFKCKNCYTTLIVADYFRTIRQKILESRNRWGLIGLIIGLFPMVLIMGMVTIKPALFVTLFIILNVLIILSLFYFKKRANDILLGIIFAELGIYANITSLVLSYFTVQPYSKNIPDLSLQTYFFLIAGILLIIIGLIRRKKFTLK